MSRYNQGGFQQRQAYASNDLGQHVDTEERIRLQAEFRAIDKDGSNRIDKNEMDVFLREKGLDDQHRGQIIDLVFSACDADRNGTIEMNEFVEHYISTKNRLLEKEAELKGSIKRDHEALR